VVFAVVGLTAPLSMTSPHGACDLCPRILEIIADIPKTAAGKVLRRNPGQT
jgi:acyl-coenzyme A synthetase/AMP-(fatty) acid ligase